MDIATIDIEKNVSTFEFMDVIRSFFPAIDYSDYDNRQRVEIIEWIMLQQFENIADELPVQQWIHSGMYYRELTIPEGTLLTGKIHPLDHIFTLSKGTLQVLTDDGIKKISAPYSFPVKAGTKKVGYACTDCVCSTVNTTDKTTIEEAEKESLIDSDLTWVDKLSKQLEGKIS
jgi:hypothetical protein